MFELDNRWGQWTLINVQICAQWCFVHQGLARKSRSGMLSMARTVSLFMQTVKIISEHPIRNKWMKFLYLTSGGRLEITEVRWCSLLSFYAGFVSWFPFTKVAAMEAFKSEFLEFGSPAMAASNADTAEDQPISRSKYAVVFLVEATGKLTRHIEMLQSAYISPILSFFRSNSTFSGDCTEYGNCRAWWDCFVAL